MLYSFGLDIIHVLTLYPQLLCPMLGIVRSLVLCQLQKVLFEGKFSQFSSLPRIKQQQQQQQFASFLLMYICSYLFPQPDAQLWLLFWDVKMHVG